MTQKRAMCVVVLLASLLGTSYSVGQVATGKPPFGSFGGGPFDTVNLANLNAHFEIPILSKAGRGMPFTYTLSYDSAVWYPTGTAGSQVWTPASNWGWKGQTEVAMGYLTFSTFTTTCFDPDFGQQTSWHWSWHGYHDQFGANHTFPLAITSDGICAGGDPTSISKLAKDGSGYTLNATDGSASITTPSGSVILPPLNTTSGAASITDANGNIISVNGSGVFTDTLGTTALTVSGAGTAASPITFAYTSPTNASVSYQLKYANKTIRTFFQCTGTTPVADYGPIANVPLVTEIDLPDYNATTNPTSKYTFTYEASGDPNNPGSVTGRLASVTLPTGGTITYTYTGGTNGINCSDGTAAVLTRTLNPGATWSYTKAVVSGSQTTTTVIDPDSDKTVLNFQGIYETERDEYQGATTLLRTTFTCYNGNGVATPSSCPTTAITTPITRRTVFTYLPDASGKQTETDYIYDTFGLINRVDEYAFGDAAVGPLVRKTITTYAALGNGIVDRPASVVIQDGSSSTKASTSYGYDQTAVTTTTSTPQHGVVTGSRGNVTTVTAKANSTVNLYRKFTYYDTGMLKTSTDVSTSSTTDGATTTYNYNNTGTSSPSCGNSFATSISEPLALSRSMTWNCTGGVLTSVIDENGRSSNTLYTGTGADPYFWRPYATTDQAGVTTNLYYSVNPKRTESKLLFNGGNSVIGQVTTFDGFSRPILSQTRQGPASSSYDSIETDYDSSGRISKVTMPYAAALGGACSGTCPGTTTTYDALDRVKVVTDGGGRTTTNVYVKNDIDQTIGPAPVVEKQSEYDALGRLASVCEITGTANGGGSCGQTNVKTGYLTTYAYDLLDNITSVTQNAQAAVGSQQTRTYVFDMLGRLTSETNPETNNLAYSSTYDTDATCGTYAGNVVKRVDAAGTVTCLTYDSLHRPLSIAYPSGGYSANTDKKFFVYDITTANGFTLTNTKGRLAQAYTCPPTGSCTTKKTDLVFSYSPRGEVIDAYQSTPHSGTPYYHTTSAYWENGVAKSLSGVPTLPTIYYGGSTGAGLDGEGRVAQVKASSGADPASSVAYNISDSTQPIGALTQIAFGSGDKDTYSYELNTGRTKQYKLFMGTTPLTNQGDLTWNTNGTLQKLIITNQIGSPASQTCNYTYDDLGRVASSNCGAAVWNQTFSYDPFGNIKKTVPPGSTGSSFQVNYDTKNRITTAPFAYNGLDASNGNLSADNAHTYSWDAEGRMVTVDSGQASGVCIIYDALGQAVEQGKGASCATAPTSTAQIIYSPSGEKLALMNGQTLTKAFVSLPAGGQAVYTSAGLAYYRHADWLGSLRLSTTPGRTKYYDVSYAPFGEPYAGSGTSQDLAFTGQNQDTVAGGANGLYDFLFREQAPVQGRWMSPDPLGLGAVNPSSPQSWNRYSYVQNTPLTATDPLGLYCFGKGDCWPDPCFFGCFPLPPCVFCGPGGGGGGGPRPGRPRRPKRTGGRYPDGETLGLPKGLNIHPASIWDLLGLAPGTECEFGACTPIGNNFVAAAAPLAAPCLTNPVCATVLVVGTIGVLYGPQIIHATKEVAEWTSRYSKCLHEFIQDVKACNDAYPPGPARDECHKKARQKFDLCKAGGTIQ
jgi:RHS repeat-associated protein